MSADLAVLVPVLNRPHRVRPFLDSVEQTTPGCHVLFLADPDDTAELEAIERESIRGDLCVKVDTGGGNYAEKIGRGVDLTSESLVFTAADDLEPCLGWFGAATAAMTDGVEVVGINDLIDRPTRPDHATHFLMTREYAERPTIDNCCGPFFNGYAHWWCDDELIATARHRGVYAYAPDAQMLHLHPMADRAEDDETYRKGRALRQQDRRLFRRRSRLWR